MNHYIYLYHTVPSNPPFNRVTRFTRMETSHWQEAKS
ncbi:MAG: hypothetical protein ABI612_21275 [Betaproteobacteria bacterium]